MKTALWLVVALSVSVCPFGFAQEPAPSAPEPPEGFAEVMVLGSSFDVVTGDVTFIVMDWTVKDERRNEKPRKTRDVVATLAAVTAVECDNYMKHGFNAAMRYDTADIVAPDGAHCVSVKVWAALGVDLTFWNKRLLAWKASREGYLKNPAPIPVKAAASETAPFAKIVNYPSEEVVVISELMGEDTNTKETLYKRREVRRDGLDVRIRTDDAFWLSVEYSGKEEAPPTVGARYARATILVPFADRGQITEWRKKFVRFQDERDMYLIEHPQK